METPVQVTRDDVELTKQTVERIHLERYRNDYLTLHGRLPFDAVNIVGDRSDFVVETANGPEAIDCTSLTLQERRTAYGLFLRVLRELRSEAGRGTFAHLKSTVIQMWFGNSDKLPPKKNDKEFIREIVQIMADCRIDRVRLFEAARRMSQEGFPEQFDPDAIALFHTADGAATFQVTPVAGVPVGDRFAEATGFGCYLHMSTEVNRTKVEREFRRIVDDHDYDRVNHLLITVGGPDKYGFRYPAEEVLLQLLSAEFIKGIPADFLRKISLHLWASGLLWELPVVPRQASS